MIIVGIDPGLSGAVAFVDRDSGELIEVADMPTISYQLADGRKRRQVDALALSRIVGRHSPGLAIIETVNSYGMGRQSAFVFGWSAGVAHAVVELAGAPIISVPPFVWKPRMGLPTGSAKDASRSLATALCGSDGCWKRKRDDGRAEAFLTALYGRRLLDGQIEAAGEGGR